MVQGDGRQKEHNKATTSDADSDEDDDGMCYLSTCAVIDHIELVLMTSSLVEYFVHLAACTSRDIVVCVSVICPWFCIYHAKYADI